MEQIYDLEKEQGSVDNYVIITCITLLAAYVVLVTSKESNNSFLIYSFTISTFSLSITLLQTLWHKFRVKIRHSYFQKKREELTKKYADKISAFAATVWDSTLKVNLIKILPGLDKMQNSAAFIEQLVKTPMIDPSLEDRKEQKNGTKSLPPIMERAFDITSKQIEDILRSYLTNMTTDVKNAHISAYRKPLSERFALIKYYFDILSKNTRYHFFTIGIIFFFISIFLSLMK